MATKRTKLAEAEARVAKQWPGLSRHRALSSFPKHALAKGAEVESEHVGGNKPLARRIAADHLVEDPKYYDRLEKQEAKMNKQKGLASGGHRIRPHSRERYTLVAFVGSERDRTYLYFDLANKRSEKPYLLTTDLGSGGTHCSLTEALSFAEGARLVAHLGDVAPDLQKGLSDRAEKQRAAQDLRPVCSHCGHDRWVYELRHNAWTCQRHREFFLDRGAKKGHATGKAPRAAKGDPTELNLSSLNREVLAHEARGDKTLHRFAPTSMGAMRRLLKAGYLAPAVGQPGHWVLTGQGEMALEGFRQREAATAARWAKPGHAAGEAVILPEDPRVECFTKAISGALKKLAARIEPKGFRLHDISYGTTLYNQGRGVIAGVPGARVSFQAVGPRGARVHFHGSFRYDREDYLVGTLTVSGAESKREWSLTRGKCAEVAKLIAAPSTFPRHEMKLAEAGHASGRAGRRLKGVKPASVQEVYEMLGALGRRAGIELGKKNGEPVIRVDLDRRHHAVISPGHIDWVADIYRADHTGTGYAEDEEHGPVLEAPALDVAMWVRALMSKAERVY